jgi:hypothetical protein
MKPEKGVEPEKTDKRVLTKADKGVRTEWHFLWS